MVKTAVVYFSGYGHTQLIAKYVAEGAEASLISIDKDGNVTDAEWNILNTANGIIFVSPTYMGSAPWQFKKFQESTSKIWHSRKWQNKAFGGVVNSASLNGDKHNTMNSLQTFAEQHGGVWVSLGLLPSNTSTSTRQDLNNLGASAGVLVQSPSDAGADAIPSGDLETARFYGARVKEIAHKLSGLI